MHHLSIRARPSNVLVHAQERRRRARGALRVPEDLAEKEGILDCLACACAVVRQGLRGGRGRVSASCGEVVIWAYGVCLRVNVSDWVRL